MNDIGVELNKIEHEDCYTYLERVKDKSIDTVISDVPYNISGNELDENGNEVVIKKKKAGESLITTDFGDWDKGDFIVEDWIKAVTPKVKDNGQIIIFNSFKNMEKMARTLRDDGWTVMGMYYWFKPNPAQHMAKRYALNSFEQYLWAVKDPNNYTFNVDENDTYNRGKIVANAQEDAKNRFHPTQKPLSLIKRFVYRHSNKNDIILDSFSGSAVTAVACLDLQRFFIGTELDKDYFEKGNKRIEKKINTTPKKF